MQSDLRKVLEFETEIRNNQRIDDPGKIQYMLQILLGKQKHEKIKIEGVKLESAKSVILQVLFLWLLQKYQSLSRIKHDLAKK